MYIIPILSEIVETLNTEFVSYQQEIKRGLEKMETMIILYESENHESKPEVIGYFKAYKVNFNDEANAFWRIF